MGQVADAGNVGVAAAQLFGLGPRFETRMKQRYLPELLKLCVRLTLVIGLAFSVAPSLFAQGRTSIQVTATVIPAGTLMQHAVAAAWSVESGRDVPLVREELGGLAVVRTEADRRRTRVTVEYAAN